MPLSTICFTKLGGIFFTERCRIAFSAYYPCNAAVKFGQKEGILVDRIIKLPTFRNNLRRQCTRFWNRAVFLETSEGFH